MLESMNEESGKGIAEMLEHYQFKKEQAIFQRVGLMLVLQRMIRMSDDLPDWFPQGKDALIADLEIGAKAGLALIQLRAGEKPTEYPL